ncbi:hypothetical protein RND81_10G156700 [Saponaria officinalis]|uniref:Amino acid transporter transmembrane domain-containing protein n=1 Tax=Saponaria officinalis TaxID=3572 RepID=A0AAW1I2G7_SAPOF
MKMEEIDPEGGRIPLLSVIDDDGSSKKGASLSSAVFNISTTMIGAGIMSIPATFKVLGIFPAVFVIFVVALMGDVTGEFMLRYTHTGKSTTYAGLMGESFGKIGSFALQICVILTSFGCLVIYLIIIGDVLTGSSSGGTVHTGILQEWFGYYWWTTRELSLFVVAILILLPLVLLRRVDSLRHTSLLAILLAVVFVVICLVMAIIAIFQGKAQSLRLLPDFSSQGTFLSLFTTVPVFMTAFGYQINVHPIRAELGEPADMKLAIRISLVICAAFYFSIGFSGYLLFGDTINADMLVNFDQSANTVVGLVINAVVRLSYAFHLLLVFPLVNYALRANVDELCFPRTRKTDSEKDDMRFVCLTCTLLALAYGTAIVIPSIWYCFQILGSTTVLCLILIFPSLIILRDIHGISTTWEKAVGAFLIILAFGASIIAIWTNLSE